MITEYKMSRSRRIRAWRVSATLVAAVVVSLAVGAAVTLEGLGQGPRASGIFAP